MVPSYSEVSAMLYFEKPYFGSIVKNYDSSDIAGRNMSLANFHFVPFIEVYNATVENQGVDVVTAPLNSALMKQYYTVKLTA